MLSTLLCGLLLQQSVAVLDDGTHIQVLPEVQVDSFHVITPHGLFRSAGQKVVELLDSANETALLAPLRALDYALWVQRVEERGLIDRLLQEPIDDGNRALIYDALARWGQRIDPLPAKIKRDFRVDRLWNQMLDAKNSQRALFVGALEGEISKTSGSRKRRVSLSDWRKAAKSKDVTLRWAAARVAGIQLESNMEVVLLDTSLEDHDEWVAFASATALIHTDSYGALHRWAYELVTAKSSLMQDRAALMLGELGSAYPKIAGELAELIRTGKYYLTHGANRGRSSSRWNSASGLTAAGNGSGRSITENSVLEVRTPSKSKMRTIARVLHNLATLEGKASIPQSTAAEGQTIVPDAETDPSKAWRKYLTRR